ncbi:dynein axonemal heavy chain 5-like [Lissotriton helveticus]
MDERHWWIAGRVQETFQVGGKADSPAILEEFFLLPENLQLINEFLQAAGPQTIFFFSETEEKTELTKWDLRIKSDLLNCRHLQGLGGGSEKGLRPTILYFMHAETSTDVDPVRMEREIFCGEIKESPVENLKCLLTELFFPVLRAQTDWGSCSQESVAHFLSGLDKYVAAIQDVSTMAKTEKQQILKRPTHIISPDFLQQRSAILDSDIVNEHEALVLDWIKTIDQILMEAVDERVLDITTTPLTELDRWHRRQKILGSITEQLRGKECKTVIGLLISAKSRLLKKWKSVDISITDASNATKDRVKYLEALYRHFDAIANENDPSNLLSNVLPALFTAIKQMDTISRFFARNGYLGLLLTKVSNQLAQSCREFIRDSLVTPSAEDRIWEKVREHIEDEGELMLHHTTLQDRKMIRDRIRSTATLGKSTLYERIQACLALHTYFQDALRQLRESLIRSPGMRRYSSSSSISTVPGKAPSPYTAKTNKPYVKLSSSITSSLDHQHDYQGSGVPMTDEDTLMYHLETLCRRLKQFLDVILKLHQFKRLSRQTEGVRKPSREDLILDVDSDSESINEFTGQEEQTAAVKILIETVKDYVLMFPTPQDDVDDNNTNANNTSNIIINPTKADVAVYQAEPFRQALSAGGPLQTLIEEDEAQISLEGPALPMEQYDVERETAGHSSEFELLEMTKDENYNGADDEGELQLSSEEKEILANLYDPEDQEEEGSTLSTVIKEKLHQMIDTLAQTVDTDVLLDIERREHNPFEEGYSEFLVLNQQLERYISVYVQALFLRRMQTKEALSILQRFSAVSHRQGIQPMIGECYVMVFDWFCEELKEIQATYESFKDDPVVPRNMPPVAGAIFWSRQLLSRIEEIMKVFRDVKIMARSHMYTHTVKLYNRIASALVAYEALWFQKWTTQVDAGLSGLKVTLLVRNPLTHQLMVNTDPRLLHLIEETKWMLRLGIQVPEAALLAFKQGVKFKQYKSDLEDVLQEYEQLQKKIPDSLANLFTSHLEAVNHQFQPGLSNLSWNSVNIEGLLYQANAAVTRFRHLIEKVTEMKEEIIEKTLEKITSLDFFVVEELNKTPKCLPPCQVDWTDHSIIEFYTRLIHVPKGTQKILADVRRPWNKLTPESFRENFIEPNWAEYGDNVNAALTALNEAVATSINHAVPLRTYKPRPAPRQEIWYTDDLRRLKIMARKSEKLWRETHKAEDKVIYRNAQKNYHKAIRSARKHHIADQIAVAGKNVKVLYQILQTFVKPVACETEGTESQVLCNNIAQFFVRKIEGIYAKILASNSSSNILSTVDSTAPFHPCITEVNPVKLVEFPPISIEEIGTLINQTKSGCPLDIVPARIMSLLRDDLGVGIQQVLNLSLASGDVPLNWKRALDPVEFVQLITDMLVKKKIELQNLTAIVHDAVLDIMAMLKSTKDAQPGSSSTVAFVKTATTGSYSRLHQTLIKAQQAEVAPLTNTTNDFPKKITEKVLEYFCDQVYKAVSISICRSLLLLAHVVGCDSESILGDELQIAPRKGGITDPLIAPNEKKTSTPHSSRPPLREIGKGIHETPQDLRFKLIMRFKIPNIIMDPPLEAAQDALKQAFNAIIGVSEVPSWWSGVSKGKPFYSSILEDKTVQCMFSHVSEVVTTPVVIDFELAKLESYTEALFKDFCKGFQVSTKGFTWKVKLQKTLGAWAETQDVRAEVPEEEEIEELRPAANNQVFHLSCYDFLWKDDMNGQCKEFLVANPELPAIHKEVERLLHIKQQIEEFTEIFQVGCICLDFSLIKETLIGFAGAWKFQYATILHHQVKANLQAAVKYREEVYKQLTVPVQSLEELNSSLQLLEEVQDMEHNIDGVYRPIEDMYEQLRSYDLRIPREEVVHVKHLRDKWTELMSLTFRVKDTLLKEKQDIFRQELDKQIKSFVVEVIQFRNSFDTQGPAAPGVRPEEAVSRLHIFQEKFQLYDAKRKTLNSVQRLFNIIPKNFPELDRTGKDLHLLGTLYVLFQKFIEFDQRFRNTLWAEVDLAESNKEIGEYWSECLVWNDKLKDWDAYIEMAAQIKFYEDIFPLLHRLAAKEIRNRHWLQVMAVTGSSFPLEANVFKVSHLLDIGLLKFQDELVSIAKAARKELELENQMRRVEEEWTEQVLNFEAYKNRGEIFLVKEDSLLLLEELEDAQVLLAHMLTSKEIDPLREEATSWAEKLKRVGDVLELWIDVQELWQHLEEIFSHSTITKELPREARRFAKVDRSWVRMMRAAFNTKNVVQCCCAGDVPKEVILKHVQEELEICFRSLTSYLNRMRQAFPRFYFLSDLALLSLLSHPWDVKYLQHHLRYLFSSVHNISVETLEDDEMNTISDDETVEAPMPIYDFLSVRSGNDGWMSLGQKSVTQMTDSETVFQLSLKSAGISQDGPRSAVYRGPNKGMTIVAVTASDGEVLQLDEQVIITSGVEVWLDKLQNTIFRTMDSNIWQVIQDVNQGMPVDEWTQKYPSQVSLLGLLYLWTKDCEIAISEMKQDRKALTSAIKKYSAMVNRLSAIVSKGTWRGTEEPVSHCQKLKLENMILHVLYLHDIMESFTSRKIREVTDFDWKRATRFYLKEKDGHFRHELNILDAQYKYGCEFYGAKIQLIMNPATEKCFLAMSQAMQQVNGVALQGDHGVGKTETTKGLAYLLGKFLFLFTCSSSVDLTALSRVLLGTAMDGCWSCFDDFHLLTENAVSVFMYGAQTIYDSLKAKHPVSALLNEQEIAVDKNCNLFLTVHWQPGFKQLPSDVRALFRTVSLCVPDHTILLRGKLTSLGFKSPKTIAKRLQLIAELVKEQLRAEKCHNHFSFQSFLGVIQRAAQKRESEKASNNQSNRLDALNDGGRTSRSSSITSVQQNIPYGASPSPSLKGGYGTDKNKKPLSSNPVIAAAKESHAIIAESLQEILGPRMARDSLAVLKQIVRDVFAGMYDPSGFRQPPAVDLEKAILSEAEEKNLSAHSPWVNKVKQLFNLSLVHPGIIVAGPPGSGKSTCISALIQALNLLSTSQQQSAPGMQDPEKATAHKLVKINPLSVDNFSLMFGYQTSSHAWLDGVVTYIWRRALRSHSNTWICFDGPLSACWADSFNSALGPEKVLQLSNGDNLEFAESMKLLFETTELHLASPATVTKAGILYLEGEVLGWKPLAKTWLDGRNQQEITVLSKAFYKTLDPILNFVLHDAKPLVPVTEVGLFSTCTNLLAAMLNDKAQSIGGQLHIERLFIFCLIWSVGGLLDTTEMKRFNELIKVYTSVLPDYENEISVFDYYVDESGEWDTWQSRLPEVTYIGNTDILGEVFVNTLDTMIVRTFMEYASMGNQHVLLIGPPGAGRTSVINDFINTQDKSHLLLKRMVFSGSTKASDLQNLIETNIVHRQGFIYGAPDGKSFQMFIDDINLPQPDANGVQHCNELLRLLLDDRVLVKLSKPFEWQSLEGLVVQAAMSLPQHANSPQRMCAKRLLRHFAIFHLPDPEGTQLENVIFSILEANMGDKEGLPLAEELHIALVKASCQLVASVKKTLLPSPTPGRQHYLFSLRDINKAFQCLQRLSSEDREDSTMVVSFWQHELRRILEDRLCRQADLNWFNKELEDVVKENFSDIQFGSLKTRFVTFPLEITFSHQKNTGNLNKGIKVLLQPVQQLDEVTECLQTYLQHYNEELGHQKLQIELSENIVEQIIRIHRVLACENSGNLLLVGSVGSHLRTLVKLSLYMADVPLHPVDTSGHHNFMNSLKSAIQMSAVEGNATAILLTAQDLVEAYYLDAINSLLTCGEYPSLFSTEEMTDLLQVLGPASRRKHPNRAYDPAKYLVSQVKSNLHVILCLPPHHELLKTAAEQYPGFLCGCQVIWIDNWSKATSHSEASHYIAKHRVLELHTRETRDHVAETISQIHTSMLQECNQIPWVRSPGNQMSLNGTERGGGESTNVQGNNVSDLPFAKGIIEERIHHMNNHDIQGHNNMVFLGPGTLYSFLDRFKYIYRKKQAEQEETERGLKKVLETLAQTRIDAKVTQKKISIISQEHEESKVTVSTTFNQLIAKASSLERLKAELGIGGEILQVFLAQNESESEDDEDGKELLKEDDSDEYDEAFWNMKAASNVSQIHEITQKIEKVKCELEEVRSNLKHVKNQVMHWCSKVDKGCIERLLRCQNPPYLVGQVLEMVLVMVDSLPFEDSRLTHQSSARPQLENRDDKLSPLAPSVTKPARSRRKDRGIGRDDKVDKAKWKSLQYRIGDSSTIIERIHNVAKLEDGLPTQTLKDVESYLAKAKEGSQGVTGEGSLLEDAAPHATPQSVTPAKKFTHSDSSPTRDSNKGGITIAGARYSSEDAATLVTFVVAVIEYTRLCGPLRDCLKKLDELEKEKEECSKEEEKVTNVIENIEEETPVPTFQEERILNAEDLPTLEAEVQQLQAEYDVAVVRKHHLQEELYSHQERLQAALDVLKSLHLQEQEWKEKVEQSSLSELLTNCVIAAAFLTYCTPLSIDGRKRVTAFLFSAAESCGLTIPPRMLLRDIPLMQFLHSPIELKKLEMKGIPKNKLALDNSCVLTSAEGSSAWVLVCDPTAQAIQWIKDHLPQACTEVQYHELRSQLDSCLTDGLSLLLTYCDIQTLSKDARFSQVLRSKPDFQHHNVPFKMMVAEHEVECHPGFQMYLHTTSLPEEIPSEVAAFCSMLYFSQDKEGLVEQLLDRFVLKEKPRLKEEQESLEQECMENMEELSALEAKMVTTLQSDRTLLHNLAVTKKLIDLKQQHDEALEMKLKIAASQKTILHVREGFQEIAVRGTVMFDTAQKLQQFNPVYQTSFPQLMELFDASVAHSERSSVKGVLSCLTRNIFSYVTKSLLEKDRLVYALLVTFEVEESLGHLKPGEKEFVIAPDLCVATLQKLGAKPSESRQQAKNPFDWMAEEQFKNVQILAMYYSWFGDLFDRMYRDGKDLTWKTFCESEQPENPAKGRWPEGLDELTPLQRLLVLRAVRADRILQSTSGFIAATLGKSYTAEFTVDLQSMALMSPQKPSMLIYSTDSCIARRLVLDLARRRNHKTIVLPITDTEETEKKVKELLLQGMSEGFWVVLENIQNSTRLMTSLEEIIKDNKNPDKNFHLWISVQASPLLPVRLLHYTVKIVVDMPKSIKGGLIQSWRFVDPTVLSLSKRPEWPAILHNMCFLHCAIRLRTEFGITAGWNYRDMLQFGCTELTEGLQLLAQEFKEEQELTSGGQAVSWTAIRYLLSEIIYGRNVTDDCDATSLTSIIDYWISPGTAKKDCELTKLKYKVPAAFFTPDVQMSTLVQALEAIPQYSLDAPEAFHMHPSPAILFGQEHYVFSQLKVLYDSEPNYSGWEEMTQSTPSSQKHRTPLANHQPVARFHTTQPGNGSLLKQMSVTEIWEMCCTLLPKVPRGWSRDTIIERLKKLGGNTPFNLFIKKELEQLMSLLSEVRRNLQAIKSAMDSEDTMGDQLSESIMSVVNDLYHKRTPAHWCVLAGNVSYPPECSASTWINEVQQHVAHFEKILHLGREKMPSYWLGAFRNPKGLLSVLKQENIRQYSERTGNAEPIVFKTEITQRDKDHIRDPPHEGMFIHGIHIWGVSWNKTDAELLDAAPKQSPSLLPVIHLHCLPMSEKIGISDPVKASDTFACPVYISSTSSREPVLHLDIQKENVPASRWALRGMKTTIYPF